MGKQKELADHLKSFNSGSSDSSPVKINVFGYTRTSRHPRIGIKVKKNRNNDNEKCSYSDQSIERNDL